MRLFRLVARGEWRWCGVWVLLTGGLSVLTAPAYAATYATAADRRAAVLLARQDAATTLLYGRLPDPGTPAQLFAWEIGAFTTLLAAVAAVLLAVRLTRATEETGTLELVRACGVPPRRPLLVAVAWLALVAGALGAAAGGGAWLRRASLDGASTTGTLAYGATAGCTFLLVALMTVVLAQVLPTTAGARRAGAFLVVTAFLLRAYGDVYDVPPAAALSPLGLRGAVRPFTDDRPAPLLGAVVAAGLLAVVAGFLQSRREPGTGLIRTRASLGRRLPVRTPLGLSARLGRASLLTWAIGAPLGVALLTAMGSGPVTSARNGRLSGGFLAEQLRSTDPAAAYLGYTARIVGIAVAAFVMLGVLRAAAAERSGVLEHLRATGARRWFPLLAQTAVATGGGLLVLGLSAVACAIIAPSLLAGDHVAAAAFRETVGQWPATVALAGATAMLVGVRPRLAALAWIPFGLSVLLTMLGTLLKLPDHVVRLGVFGHAPSSWTPSALTASLTLVASGVALAAIGMAGAARRDQVTG